MFQADNNFELKINSTLSITSSSKVWLTSVDDLDSTYEATYTFNSLEAQRNFFIGGKTPYEVTRVKGNVVQLDIFIESAMKFNYLAYTNGNKLYYCFITDINYKSERCTEFTIEMDYAQSFYFDWSLGECFVEREHDTKVNTDEGLDIGNEYIEVNEHIIASHQGGFIMASTEPLEAQTHNDKFVHLPVPIQGCPTSLFYYYLTKDEMVDFLKVAQFCPSIINVSYCPFIPTLNLEKVNCYGVTSWQPSPELITEEPKKTAIAKLNRILGASIAPVIVGSLPSIVRSNKLDWYPYHYYLLSDGQAEPLLLKPELMGESTHVLAYVSIVHPLKIRYFLDHYRGGLGSVDNVTNAQVNDISLSSSQYIDYLNSSKASFTSGVGVNMVQGAIGGAMVGSVQGAIVGSVVGGVGGILKEMAKRQDIQQIPRNLKANGNNIAFEIASSNTKIRLYEYRIQNDVKTTLESFWNRYGYKVNRVKSPNQTSRSDFNYVKTNDCIVKGSIPNMARQTIANAFNNGITLIHK